ncbi:AraC family transcriptional regulator [Pedobacter psychrodurus]|uniref:AraC family transcriptional regulator n=1 Tax=Pedobacter psychrodurus TaxID=2530456 RepID=A0A4R0Q6H5_9SPHI|nr:AraC family transcriptional regulator [Pedobacter psychrodurus]
MRPLVQKLPLNDQASFVARKYTSPYFETAWHQHEEHELVLQLDGKGMCFIGNYIGEFNAGDIFFLGSNVPHEFKKDDDIETCSALVIHFKPDVLGKDFLALPEFSEIKTLLADAVLGFKFQGIINKQLNLLMTALSSATGFERITLLCQCMLLMSRVNEKATLSTITEFNHFSNHKINKVFEYTILNFRNQISLKTIADIANLSIPAFCRYFKRKTKKTYIEFVNEMKIGYACQSLIDSEETILQISYASGFNTIANFNKQFIKVKGIKPSVYRKNLRPVVLETV